MEQSGVKKAIGEMNIEGAGWGADSPAQRTIGSTPGAQSSWRSLPAGTGACVVPILLEAGHAGC